MSGFFAVYRQIEENFLHPLQQKRKFTQYEAWLDLIGFAYFKDKEKFIQGKKVLIERGSFDTSAMQLAERWKWDRETVERFLKLLQREEMINRSKINPKNPKSATILKINKYNDFQNIFKNDTATDATLDATMDATPKNKDNKVNKEINIYNNIPFEEIKNSFNEICPDIQITKITPKRMVKVTTRWKEQPDLNYWIGIFKKVQNSDFLKGKNDRNWKCSFDWIFKNDTNYIKIDEGKYSNKTQIFDNQDTLKGKHSNDYSKNFDN